MGWNGGLQSNCSGRKVCISQVFRKYLHFELSCLLTFHLLQYFDRYIFTVLISASVWDIYLSWIEFAAKCNKLLLIHPKLHTTTSGMILLVLLHINVSLVDIHITILFPCLRKRTCRRVRRYPAERWRAGQVSQRLRRQIYFRAAKTYQSDNTPGSNSSPICENCVPAFIYRTYIHLQSLSIQWRNSKACSACTPSSTNYTHQAISQL